MANGPLLNGILTPNPGSPMTFNDRLQGLLTGGNPLFDVGLGMLAASGPSRTPINLGQVFAGGVGFAGERQREQAQNAFIRERLLTAQQRRQAGSAVQELIGSLGGQGQLGGQVATPQQQQFLNVFAQTDPTAALQLYGGLLGIGAEPKEFSTDIGKLFADRDLAEQHGDKTAISAIEQTIQQQLGPDVNFDDLRSARNDTIQNSQTFLTQKAGFERVQIGAESASPAGDVALAFGVMKLNDPASTVREGEFATIENAGSIPERIRGLYNKALTGELLTPELRADFLSQARSQFSAAVEQQQSLVDDARKFASRNELPVDDVVPAFVVPSLPQVTDTAPRTRIRVDLQGNPIG